MLPLLFLTAFTQTSAIGPNLTAAMAELKLVRRADLNLADLRGDWDGDGKPDCAVAVVKGKDRGVLVVWGGQRPPVLLGAASDFNHFRDHDFDQWEVRPAKAPAKKDAMVWIWSEKASARIVWNGKVFRWIQEGD